MSLTDKSFHLPVDHWEIILEQAQAKAKITEDPTEAFQLQRIYDIISSYADSINALLRDKDKYKGNMPHYSISFSIDLVQHVTSLLPK